jgi:hypothetical protein
MVSGGIKLIRPKASGCHAGSLHSGWPSAGYHQVTGIDHTLSQASCHLTFTPTGWQRIGQLQRIEPYRRGCFSASKPIQRHGIDIKPVRVDLTDECLVEHGLCERGIGRR